MGSLLDLTVPVRDRHGVEGFLTCEQVFVYSAENSNGCIVGYPFLKCYVLQLLRLSGLPSGYVGRVFRAHCPAGSGDRP